MKRFKEIFFLLMGFVLCLSGCDDYAPERDYALEASSSPGYEISLNFEYLSLNVGDTRNLNDIPQNEYYFSWSSSNPSVASVDNRGEVTALSPGTTTITCQSLVYSHVKASCEVTVINNIRTFTVKGVTFNMIYVEPGTFQMGSTVGSNDEKPVHSVTLTKGYYMGETEVTQALWKAVTGYSPVSGSSYQWIDTKGLGPDYPAYYISYKDVENFITELNKLTGVNFRMPTEAEWEFAARGGNKSKGYKYSGSDEKIDDVAWYWDNSGSMTHPVKTKAANELGLYDMSGNVWEWCSDWYAAYSSSAQTNPTGFATGFYRVFRGGSWSHSAAYCRCASRGKNTPTFRNHTGFRLAL